MFVCSVVHKQVWHWFSSWMRMSMEGLQNQVRFQLALADYQKIWFTTLFDFILVKKKKLSWKNLIYVSYSAKRVEYEIVRGESHSIFFNAC